MIKINRNAHYWKYKSDDADEEVIAVYCCFGMDAFGDVVKVARIQKYHIISPVHPRGASRL